MTQGYQLKASTILSFKDGRVGRSTRVTEIEQLKPYRLRAVKTVGRTHPGWFTLLPRSSAWELEIFERPQS